MAYVLLRRRFMALLTRECPGGTRAYKVRNIRISGRVGEKHQGVGLGALPMASCVCVCVFAFACTCKCLSALSLRQCFYIFRFVLHVVALVVAIRTLQIHAVPAYSCVRWCLIPRARAQ